MKSNKQPTFPVPYAKTSKNSNRRAQLLSGGSMPGHAPNSHVAGGAQQLGLNTNQNSLGNASAIMAEELEMSKYSQVQHKAQSTQPKSHQRNATMMLPHNNQGGPQLLDKLNITQPTVAVGISSPDGPHSQQNLNLQLNTRGSQNKQSSRRTNAVAQSKTQTMQPN